MALTDLTAVKDHLGIPPATTTFDARLTRFIDAASQAIENFLDRTVLTATYTEIQDGRASNRVILRNFPVTSVTSVYIDPDSEFTDPSTEVDSSDFRLEDESLIVLLHRQFPRGTQNVRVIYDAGYATVPPVIENSCLFLVEWYYDLQNDLRVGNVSKGKNNETTKYLTEWPKWLKDQLMPYRRSEWPIANAPVENL